ncbi:MAG: GNAT family N-acetyltransferase [Chloroflexota bacterium]
MDAIAEMIDVAFSGELAVQGTDIRTEVRMIKKLVPLISILQRFSETFRHVFDGFIFEDQGKTIALVNISRTAPKSKRWEIGNVATHPEYRRKGLARKLVTQVIEHARRHGAEACTLEVRTVNTPAYELYRDLGFTHYDSINELKLENLPDVEPLPAHEFSVRPMKLSEWEPRYQLALREIPADVQAFMPINQAEYRISLIEKVFEPIAKRAQKMDTYRWAFEMDGQLVGYVSLSARRVTKVTHHLVLRAAPEYHAALIEPMLSLALSKLKTYPKNNTILAVRSSYQEFLSVLERYGFVVYDEMHRLGLKLNNNAQER